MSTSRGRKDYYRFVESHDGNHRKATEHTAEKNKWYKVRDS
ncbi:hypothetical protein MY1884_009623 [Beauveria asiatica]